MDVSTKAVILLGDTDLSSTVIPSPEFHWLHRLLQRSPAPISLVLSSTIFLDVIVLQRLPTESLRPESCPDTRRNTLIVGCLYSRILIVTD